MPAPKENQFWKARSSHGRKPIFESAEELWNACVEYFEWVEENPLYEDKVFHFQGSVIHEPMAKMRAMSVVGLCNYLVITEPTWRNYKVKDKSDEGFFGICTRVESIIKQQKFEGAAAELLNPAIIASDLGLKNKIDHSSEDGTMSPTGKGLDSFYADQPDAET